MSDSTRHIRQSLKTIGFTDAEAKVFLVLLKQKKMTARDISQEIALPFSAVGFALASLVKHKLAHCIPDATEDQYKIANNQYIFQWIQDQKQEHQNIYKHVKNDLFHFFALVKNSSWKPDVSYFEGTEGIQKIYEDILKIGKDVYGWSDLEKKKDILGDQYVQNFSQRRIDANITTHTIKPKKNCNTLSRCNTEKKEVKLIDFLPINGEVRIYGNKVALIKHNPQKPVGFVFEGEWVQNLFKTLFDSAWKN